MNRLLFFVALIVPITGTVLGGIYLTPQLPDVVIMLVGTILTMVGLEMGFHRGFSHKAFCMGPKMRYALGALGSSAFCGPLLWFVGIHRLHHKHADSEKDIHSPQKSFWHAYHGWMIMPAKNNAPGWKRAAKNCFKNPVDANIHRGYLVFVVLGLIIPALIMGAYYQTWEGALRGLVWGGVARVALVLHGHCIVNAVGHAIGTQPSGQRDKARNLWFLGLPSFGMLLHNNHHTYPAYASFSLRWYEIDPLGGVVWVLEKFGLIWDVKRGPITR